MPGRVGRQVDHYRGVNVACIRADFSCECDADFRYTLRLPFAGREESGRVAVILKNPSAADVSRADTTIRRVEKYVHRHFPDASDLVILNLYAYRATATKDVKDRMNWPGDAIGPCNDYYIESYCTSATDIILAWGGPSSIPEQQYSNRKEAVCCMLRALSHGRRFWTVPKSDGSVPSHYLHGLRWAYCSRPCRAEASLGI